MPSVGEHQLDTLVHRGSTSEVWRAMRLGPNGFAVPVALKTLNEACAAVPEQVSGFLREARAASSVQHRNVIQARELIFDRDRYWMSMELVTGWSVGTLLSEIEASRQRIPIPVALSLVRDAVRGVEAIHEAGLVHRNVAPDNLMIDSAGQIVVLDFGFATWQHAQRIRFTPPVEVLDPVYSSPDLRARLPVDARTDVFSLGALLDQLIPRSGEVPVALDAIIRRALDPDTARRFPSAQALEIALDLLAIREGWLVPQSYVAAYVTDLLRSAAPAPPRLATGSNAGVADLTPPPVERRPTTVGTGAVTPPPVERRPTTVGTGAVTPPPVERRPATVGTGAVLPRGRRGMVGVGALMATVRPENPPVLLEVPDDELQHMASSSLTVTLVRERR